MTPVTFDTSVIIAYKVQTVPEQYLWSAVVLAELTSGAADTSICKAHEATRQAAAQEEKLIVPTAEDWLLASRILFWLSQSRKKKAGGKVHPMRPGATQGMMMDALIAVSAKRARATVVTNDWDDYKAIQYYCRVKLVRGSEYFRHSIQELDAFRAAAVFAEP